jgi:hypothetical protein
MDQRPFRGVLAEAHALRHSGEQLDADTWRSLLLPPERALTVPTSDDRSAWGPGSPAATAVEELLRTTGANTEPWPVPLASEAVRFHRDGNRDRYEQAVFSRQDRLSAVTVAAAVDPSPQRLDHVADGVVLLCEQSTWCWPAHDDAADRHGSLLAVVTDPFVDLGAAEVVAQLAWIDQVLGAELDRDYPGLRERIRHEAMARVFRPFVQRRDWHWLGLDGDVHNWNPWIHSQVIVAATRLLDSEADALFRAQVVALAWEGLDRYVSALPPDGAIDEGYGYWWNGACRALEALLILHDATAGHVDVIGDVPSLRHTVAFPHSMHLGGEWFLNLSDARAKPEAAQPWQALHAAALAVSNRDAAAFALEHREQAVCLRPGLGRLLRALTDSRWSEGELPSDVPRFPAASEAAPPPGTADAEHVWLPSVQVMLAREHADGSGLTLAAKGGHNAENHNHLDVGSFVVASDGVPVIVDPGRPTYTAESFGPRRYEHWCLTSRWHNVPRILGRDQVPGQEHAARDVAAERDGVLSRLSLELAGAYDLPQGITWTRRCVLDRASGTITITDRTDADPATSFLQLVLHGRLEMGSDSIEVLPFEAGSPVRIGFFPASEPQVSVRTFDDPQLTEVWGERLTRLRIPLGPEGAITTTITSKRSE